MAQPRCANPLSRLLFVNATKTSPIFDVRMEQTNKDTIAAMLEAERLVHDPSVKRYSDVEEALLSLKE